MVNNIGFTQVELPRIIGEETIFSGNQITSIQPISGLLSVGYLLFDDNGTISVCRRIDTDAETNENSYIFRTAAISADIAIIETDEQFRDLLVGQLYIDNRPNRIDEEVNGDV